jgi:hypothetical protein
MIAKQSMALVLVFTWLAQEVSFAGQKLPPLPARNARLLWIELGPVAVDRKAKVTLADGTKVEGQVLAVRPDSLVIVVTKTSNKHVWPKSQAAIPRSSVSEFRLLKDSGPGKLIGGVLGTVGGIFGATGAAYYAGAAGLLVGLLIVLPAAAVGGYYLGKAADMRTRLITILPDAPPDAPQAEE